MNRKFRTKRNIEYTPQEKRLNYLSAVLIIMSSIIFFALSWLNKAQEGYGSGRDIAGMLVISALLLTMGFAISLQLPTNKRLLFSLAALSFSFLAQFDLFNANTFILAAVVSAGSVIFLLYSFSRDIFASTFTKSDKS